MCEITNKKLAVIVIGLTIVLLLFMKLHTIEHMTPEQEDKPITKTIDIIRNIGENIGNKVADVGTTGLNYIGQKLIDIKK